MQLEPQERFALLMLFAGTDPLATAVRANLVHAQVTERRSTGLGFFTTVKFMAPLPEADRSQWDWNFKHEALTHGGSFISWREDPNTLGLEAVSHHGDWPTQFDPS